MKKLSTLLVSGALTLGALPYTAAHADDQKAQISMDQLPKAVREAIQREAQGGRVDEVSKVSDDGRLFKAEIKKGETDEHLYVDSNGKVVGKHMEK